MTLEDEIYGNNDPKEDAAKASLEQGMSGQETTLDDTLPQGNELEIASEVAEVSSTVESPALGDSQAPDVSENSVLQQEDEPKTVSESVDEKTSSPAGATFQMKEVNAEELEEALPSTEEGVSVSAGGESAIAASEVPNAMGSFGFDESDEPKNKDDVSRFSPPLVSDKDASFPYADDSDVNANAAFAPSDNPPLDENDPGPDFPVAEENKEEEAPWSATMTVDGTVYAASIFWQPLQSPDNPLPEVRETAENVLEDADLYVVRPSGMPQYGLGISAEGHRSGMPVAALGLVDTFSDVPSSVSVFKVPEGWWFIAIRNDLILSEEDMLYLNEEDAKRNFISMMAVPDWGRKIAPAEWGIEGTEERSLSEVLAKAPKVKLSKLSKEFNIKTTSMIAVAVILLGWGVFYLLSFLFGGSDVIEKVIAPPPVVKSVVEAPKVPSLPMPWESLIIPSEFIKACTESVSQLAGAKVPGWTMGDVTCTTTGLSTSWTMQWGRMANFQSVMGKYDVEGLHYTVGAGGKTATGTIPFNNIRKTVSVPNFTAQEVIDELTDIFQAINLQISITMSTVNPDPNKKDGPQLPTYSFVNFSFSSDLPASEWNYFFNHFDALELTNLVYNPVNNSWKYEGRIYGKK